MPSIVSSAVPVAPVKRLDAVRPRMAKAVKEIEMWRIQVGAAVTRCFALAAVSQKEAASKIGRDPAQIARWENGTERPHLDAILNVPEFRQPLVIAIAELAGVEVETHIRVRSSR